MEQIIIRVKDKKKSKMLVEILRAMNFVDIVSAEGAETDKAARTQKDAKDEKAFFAAAGLWEGRNINLEAIRKRAWPRLQ
jgi:hypothetical protein